MTVDLWTEKHRPRTLDEYVWRDPDQREKIEEWIAAGALPHVLFAGPPGTGKTSLADLLLRLLDIPSGDIMRLNASRERKIEDIQDKVVGFVGTWALGPSGIKYVLLDEADSLSPLAQRMLRGEIENYSDICRFILTCVPAGTRVYSPAGWKNVEDVQVGDMVATGTGATAQNKNLRVTSSQKLLRIVTRHGFEISVTPEHRFLVGRRWVHAKDMALGDRIAISLKDVFGTNVQITEANSLLDKEKFITFLKEKGYLPRIAIEQFRDAGFFIPPCYLRTLYDLAASTLDVDSFARSLGTTKTCARQVMARLMKTRLVTKAVVDGQIRYSADWPSVALHIDNAWRRVVAELELTYDDYEKIYYAARVSQKDLDSVVEKVAHVFEGGNQFVEVLGRLTGFLFGDGNLNNKTMHFAAGRREVLERVAADLNVLRRAEYRIEHNGPAGSSGLKIHVADYAFCLLFEFIGVPVGNKVNQVMCLPPACHESLRFGRSFIQALFDCEATTPRVGHKNRTIDPIVLRLNTKDRANSFITEVSDYLAAIGVENTVNVSKGFKARTPNGSPPKDHDDRFCGKLVICRQEAIQMFFETVGSFYEPKKHRPDLLGYLRYKADVAGYDMMSLDQWCEAYDYCDGVIQDKIVSISERVGEVTVYDCCLSEIHSYVTEGFISHNCNQPERITDPIKSRLQQFAFKTLDKDRFIERIMEILVQENVQVEIEPLMTIVDKSYPDMRKCIGLCQQYTRNGVLTMPQEQDVQDTKDYLIEAANMFKTGKTLSARKLIVENAQIEDYPDIYRFLYRNLDVWAADQDGQDRALLIVRKGLVHHGIVADPEINLSATLCELAMNANG